MYIKNKFELKLISRPTTEIKNKYMYLLISIPCSAPSMELLKIFSGSIPVESTRIVQEIKN